MLILDLRWTLVILFLLFTTTVALFLWLLWHKQRQLDAQAPTLEFPSALQSAPFGLLLLQESTLLYGNTKALELLGIEDLAFPEAEWVSLLQEDIHTVDKTTMPQGVYRSVVFSMEQAVTWWVIPSNDCIAVFVLDLSEQHHVQRQTDALIHDLGHELRTPIATMLTHIDILGFEDVSTEVREQSLTVARQETQRLARLVDDLLQLGRVSTSSDTTRRPTDIVQLVEGVLTQTQPVASRRGAVISLQVEDSLVHMRVDPDQIRQVFLNLVDNAVKYGGQDVRVTIQLANRDTGLLCTVSDDGPGIPTQHLAHVTERFYRVAQNDIQGSGLGLALVTEILRQHGSALALNSPVSGGRGTCAQFILPFGEGI